MTPSSAPLERVKVKIQNHWELGVSATGRTTFEHALAVKVLASAHARNHPAYIVPADPKVASKYRRQLEQRALIGHAARWLAAREPQVHYPKGDIRVMNIPKTLTLSVDGKQLSIDCSQYATFCYRVSGAPDPNGHGYDPHLAQFTGSFLDRCKLRPISKLMIGDTIVYGPGTGVHMVVVVDPHPTDPLVASHGQEAGPVIIRHSVEAAFHRSKGRGLVIPEWA